MFDMHFVLFCLRTYSVTSYLSVKVNTFYYSFVKPNRDLYSASTRQIVRFKED